jgi:hypothetical protein
MTTTFIHPLTSFIEKTLVITEFELRKLRHDFTNSSLAPPARAMAAHLRESVLTQRGDAHGQSG